MHETGKEASELLRGAPRQLALCFKLAELDLEWVGIVGEEFARRSCIASCSLEPGYALIMLHTVDGATATSMNFLKNKLARILRDYLELKAVRVEIKIGKIVRRKTAKPSLPAWKRRVPVIIGDDEVTRELEFTAAACGDEELARSFARVKALVERRKKRK